MMKITLDKLEIGKKGKIVEVKGNRLICKRLAELGFVKGVEIEICKEGPFGDPLDIKIKGFHITLRKAEAKGIVLECVL